MALRHVKPNTDMPPYAVSDAFNDALVTHGFFGREGGKSRGRYESLNAGIGKSDAGDDIDNIYENRRRIASTMNLPSGRLVSLAQDHTTQCFSVGPRPWTMDLRPVGDSMVTDQPNTGLGILTADCAPVLFHAPKAGVIGAAHAGHKGALGGVLEMTIVAMMDLGAQREDIIAVIGPCIGPDSYEVSKGFDEPFLREDPVAWQFFKEGKTPDKLMFDLPGYCIHRLQRARIGHAGWVGEDTLPAAERYFSHRRTTLAGETRRGLQMSVISLKHS